MLTLLLLGCADKLPPPPESRAPVALTISPEEATIRTGPVGGESLDFEITAIFEDGSEEPLSVVEWTLSNSSVGELDEDGVFTPSNTNGGDTWVSARLDEVEAQATVRVIYEAVIQSDADVDADSFPEPEADRLLLDDVWRYPEDGVNLPRNTPSIEFQWAADLPEGTPEAWWLRFESDFTDLSVYTRDTLWAADEDTWQTIAATNAGGQVTLTLTALLDDGTAHEVEPLTVQVNRLDARGAIIYWSTSVQGFKEIVYGEESVDFFTQDDAGGCMGCHTIQGDRLAFTYGGVDNEMGVLDLETRELVSVPTDDPFLGLFKSFSPDGELLLAVYRGDLLLYDGQTLEYRWQVPVEPRVTQVDWSPDGTRIALVLPRLLNTDMQFYGGDIAVMDHLGDGQFSDPLVIYRSEPDENAYYPAWSPDGEWLAFNISTGDAYDDPDAELMLMRAEVDAEPIALKLANQGGQLTNSWPRWGPLPDDDIFWLTFASRRPYGELTEDTPQIWVAAVDPSKADEGEDPSWPAFWLPSQDIIQNNHLPYWTER